MSLDMEAPNFSNCDEVNKLCPVEATLFGDYFSTGACVFFVASYTLVLAAQAYLGWRAKTWSFAAWLAVGVLCEFVGYAGRLKMIDNPWNFDAFMAQQLGLVLGPTFIAAAISITFKHLVVWYGAEWSILRPSLYPWIFVGTDVISILVQGAGGGISSAAGSGPDSQDMIDLGNNLLIGGVSFQVVNMVCCGSLMLVYMWRRNRANKNPTKTTFDAGVCWQTANGHQRAQTKWFVRALAFAYVAIIIRCIYRIPEMALGWGSELMQDEVSFLVLDGAMILISVITLTAAHPAILFPFMGKKRQQQAPSNYSTNYYPSDYQEIEMGGRRR